MAPAHTHTHNKHLSLIMNKLENNGENDNCGVVFSAFVLFMLLELCYRTVCENNNNSTTGENSIGNWIL